MNQSGQAVEERRIRRTRAALALAEPGVPLAAGGALAGLAQRALRTFELDALLREFASAVVGILRAESCAVFERLAPGDQLFLRASAGRGASPEGLSLLTAGGPGVGVVPVPGEPPFGVLAVRLSGGRPLSKEETAVLVRVAGLLGDAINRIRTEARYRHQALHDTLTGLPNRQLALDRLELSLAGTPRSGSPVAVLYLDLDEFKLTNDRFGHATGDRLLAEVGRRLSSALRPTDTLARVGGDEFLVICPDLGPEEVTRVARRLAAALAPPFLVDGDEVWIEASTGIALAEPGVTADALLARADSAMYRAKRTGGGRWEIADGDEENEPRDLPAATGLPLAVDDVTGLLAGAIASDHALAELASPLLDVLVQLGRFECAFLALAGADGEQEIRLARQTARPILPTGLRLRSADRLWRQACEGVLSSSDARRSHAGSPAVAEQGLGRFVSAPLRRADGRVFGLLGAAHRQRGPVAPPLAATVEVYAGLLSAALEVSGSQERLEAAPARSRESTDSLLRLWASFTAMLLDPEHRAPLRLDGATMGFAVDVVRAGSTK